MSKVKSIDVKRLIESKQPRLAKWLPKFIIRYLKKILHEDEINSFLEENKTKYNSDFCEAVVNYLGIDVRIEGIDNIPKYGPAIIAMNHPLGGMDAMALVTALKSHRNDLKFIVNDLLMNLDNLKDLFVGINKHGKNETTTRQKVHDAFESDEVLCIFPAGLVSRKKNGEIRDLDWKKTFITYAKKFEQPIIPVYIDGELSAFFYRLANFRKFLGIKTNIEMLYLADELFNQRGKTIKFSIGKPITPNQLDKDFSDAQLAQEIKNTVYNLSLNH